MRSPTWVVLGLALATGGAVPARSAGGEASGSSAGAESAIVTRIVKDDDSPVPVTPARLARRDVAVLASALADARSKVASLVARAEGMPPGPELDALQAAIVRSKIESRVSFLRLQMELALRAGDDERAALAARVLEAYAVPSRVVPDAPPQTPDKGRPEGGEQ